MEQARNPRTPEEVAALDAAYRPFDAVSAWSGVSVDTERWQRHADGLRDAVGRTDADAWVDLRNRFLRAAALDSTGLSELIRPAPDITSFVLRSSLSDSGWSSLVEATQLVVECHRRALVVAADAAEAGRPVDEDLMARLQDLIVESQETFTVSDEQGRKLEAELPRRQYKAVSNYVFRGDGRIEPFAPAAMVAVEMSRLSTELASEAFAQLHPVLQSAYAHSALTRIHPFADGNGRLARTVASIWPLRATGLPQLILADQWPAYSRALDRTGDTDARELIELFLAAQVNTMDLARGLLERSVNEKPDLAVAPISGSAERTLLDLVQVHLRGALGLRDPERRVAVSRIGADTANQGIVRVALTDGKDAPPKLVEFSIEPDGHSDWLRVTSSFGDVLELWRDDVHPSPTEIVHLRVTSWLDRIVHRQSAQGRVTDGPSTPGSAPAAAEPAQARGLFVLGVPRSGTTLIGNYIGSHPLVLDLAEYGGFYIAHSVAPSYINLLPGSHHAEFLADLQDLALTHASGAARERGYAWFCDATPWNLHIAGALAATSPEALFVLMLRHFSGSVLSLRQFYWAGETWADAARLWVKLNGCIEQLPADRTVVVGYDAFTSHPAETVAGIREALRSVDLDPDLLDDRRFTASHAAIDGRPRPTVASLEDGKVIFHPIPSLDLEEWTPEVHAEVWPVVKEMHASLLDRFPGIYVSPARPQHVAEDEW